ncbi:flagellar basal body-associated protein FliL/plastocyanin [Microbacterium sp. SORGH_AS428]|uniref:cohesin domain-containing protein n=1 Tax=Microbacterium sp. SORGH_AS_0428 TaxID=3041788 RepID=UPI002864EC27|nr:cohesin domain-containing protein [Microbacterium sp. SORGH_AS_0428]MDR6199318.1 flagellar basal body-associated protein FliL/plastocyanin [Microbacterium sp. SORGH_AS_0428]
MPDSRARSGRSGPRLRRPVIIAALVGLVIAPLTATAVATAVSANAKAAAIATLSASEGVVGDALTLTLDTADADDVYAAAVSLSFDASRLTFDEDAVTSDFPGMYSVVGEIDGDEGRLDFTLTRLGTSSGAAGDFSLGELGFTSAAWGDAAITIDAVTLVDSELGRIEQKPGTTLTFRVPAPPEPTTEPTTPPTEPTTPPTEPTTAPTEPSEPTNPTTPTTPTPTTPNAPSTPNSPTVIAASGYGTTVTKPSSGTVVAAPQTSAAPTNQTAQIAASSAKPAPGDTVELTVTGLAANTAHRIELHSDPIVLGTAVSDATGSFTFTATIPKTAPTGEHEIVVLADDAVVATLPITITEATASPAPTASPSASAPAATEVDTDAASSADSAGGIAWWIWIVVALIVVLIAAVIALTMSRNRSKEKSE